MLCELVLKILDQTWFHPDKKLLKFLTFHQKSQELCIQVRAQMLLDLLSDQKQQSLTDKTENEAEKHEKSNSKSTSNHPNFLFNLFQDDDLTIYYFLKCATKQRKNLLLENFYHFLVYIDFDRNIFLDFLIYDDESGSFLQFLLKLVKILRCFAVEDGNEKIESSPAGSGSKFNASIGQSSLPASAKIQSDRKNDQENAVPKTKEINNHAHTITKTNTKQLLASPDNLVLLNMPDKKFLPDQKVEIEKNVKNQLHNNSSQSSPLLPNLVREGARDASKHLEKVVEFLQNFMQYLEKIKNSLGYDIKPLISNWNLTKNMLDKMQKTQKMQNTRDTQNTKNSQNSQKT